MKIFLIGLTFFWADEKTNQKKTEVLGLLQRSIISLISCYHLTQTLLSLFFLLLFYDLIYFLFWTIALYIISCYFEFIFILTPCLHYNHKKYLNKKLFYNLHISLPSQYNLIKSPENIKIIVVTLKPGSCNVLVL